MSKITKKEWERAGGLQNPKLARKANKRGGWTYYRIN